MTTENNASTYLHSSPFYIFNVTTRDNRQKIVELIEDNLSVAHEICDKARTDLTNPRNRLSHEMAWLPGISPNKAVQLIEMIVTDPKAIFTGNLPDLSQANLISASIEYHSNNTDNSIWADWICHLANVVDEIDIATVQRDINEDRGISDFPLVTNTEFIEHELEERKHFYCNVIKNALDSVPTQELIKIMIKLVDSATNNGNHHAPLLIDQVVDIYEVEVKGFLDKEYANAKKIVETIKALDDYDDDQLSKYIEKLESITRNWNRVAQPIKVNAKARGTDHDLSSNLAYLIRSLAMFLFNEHDKLTVSKRLTKLLQETFSDLPEIAELTSEDFSTLSDIELSRKDKGILEPIYNACGVAISSLEANPGGAHIQARNVLNETTRTFTDVAGTPIHPSAVQDAKNTVAQIVFSCAIAYGNKTDDWNECVDLLEKALTYTNDNELIKKIEENLKVTRRNKAYIGDYKPIDSAPVLWTLNGIGFKTYGESDKDPDTGTYCTTYYFTVIFIPIFPICRYRISDAQGGGYHFHGKGPLRKFDKIHLGIVIAFFIWVFAFADK